MKPNLLLSLLTAGCIISACASQPPNETAVKDIFGDRFTIGTAVTVNQTNGDDPIGQQAIIRHFNSIVAENCMKCEKIHPEKDSYNWQPADEFVEFGVKNNMEIIGHCLIWHSQCAPWFLVNEKGDYVSADTLRQRMKDHIYAVAGRYKGKIKGWDVVNEAIMEDGSYRKSPFYEILGEEFIPLAFQYAHEADPDAELYLNDYSMAEKGKRETYVRLIKQLKERGLRIDGIGMQSHVGLDYPDLTEYEKSLKAFAAAGVNVMVTELDLTALPAPVGGANISDTAEYNDSLNPYKDGLPVDMDAKWNSRMKSLMDIYLRNADAITRVTAWGVCDGDSWRNGWPVPGRTDYPLFLDRNHEMKPFLIELDKELNNNEG